MSQYGISLFDQVYANRQPYHADVALTVSHNSILYQKNYMDLRSATERELGCGR
jgi:hypothetical protein